MKLIFIKKNFLNYGGAENYMQSLVQRFRGKADIHIAAKKWAAVPGATFHKIGFLSLSSFLSTITFNMNVCREIKKIKADCVISFERTTCQDIYRAGEGCHIEWLRLRRIIDPWWKRYTFGINPLHIALLKIEEKAFRNTRLIIANSNMVKSQIINHYGIQGERIKVIYNGVDTKRFSPQNITRYRAQMRRELSISPEAKVILLVGSGFERKGVGTLIRAASVIRSGTGSNSDIRLIVAGRGDINKFKGIAGKYGIQDRVLFPGSVNEAEKIYAAADVFVLPTIYDPFSNATLEAMASGLPVVTTQNNGASELIREGEEGFVTEDATDYRTLAEKISIALSNQESMGNKAQLTAEKYPIEQAAEEFMKAISELMSGI